MVNKITDGDFIIVTITKDFNDTDRNAINQELNKWLKHRGLDNVKMMVAAIGTQNASNNKPIDFTILSANDPIDSLLKG